MQANDDTESSGASGFKLLWPVLILVAVALVAIGMLLPLLPEVRVPSRSAICQSNMRNIVLAILNYELVHQHFPRAVTRDDNGANPRSWRVEVLPQLEQQSIRDRYSDNLPWDAPSNLEIAKLQMRLFQCPSVFNRNKKTGTFKTSYVLITGPGTVFPADKHITNADIKDGTSNTIIMMEIMDSDIAWTEPRDLTIDEAIALFNRPESVRKKHPTNHQGGRMVAFADGHIDFAPEDTPPEVLRALFTIDDGIPISLDSSSWGDFLDDE